MIDLHLHTTASDGQLHPPDLVARAAAAGVTTLSVTDHDTVAGLGDARETARARGLTFVNGIEITAVERGRDIHILGYFFDPDGEELAAFLEAQRADRVRRVEEIAARLASLGFAINIAPLVLGAAAARGKSIGRPQVADALVAAGHAADRNDAFDRLIGHRCPAYVARRGASPEEVIGILRRAGGVASLAHPGLLRRDAIIPRLAAAGLAALEVRHSDHDEITEQHYRRLASRHGLAVSGGSDFHGDLSHHQPMLGVLSMEPGELEALIARKP